MEGSFLDEKGEGVFVLSDSGQPVTERELVGGCSGGTMPGSKSFCGTGRCGCKGDGERRGGGGG